MKKVRLLVSVGLLVLTIAVGLTCTTRTTRADEGGGECNCVNLQNQSGQVCTLDGVTRCCINGCYWVVD
jgi:hypothetical protein